MQSHRFFLPLTFAVVFSFSLLGFEITSAEEFHVARSTPGASDSNDGLSATYTSDNHGPWKTLQHAAYNAQAGDTVVVHKGNYRKEDTGWNEQTGFIWLDNSGTEGAPIRYVAAPGDRPLVHTFMLHNKSWIEIEGFWLVADDFNLPHRWPRMPSVVVDDPSIVIDPAEAWETREPKVRQKYSTYMALRDTLSSSYSNSIDVKNSNHITIRTNVIRRYCFGIQVRGQSSDILIDDNEITFCRDGIFSWNPSRSIVDSVIRNNTIEQCFISGMQIRQGAKNVLIENNTIRNTGISHISVLAESTDITIRGNRVLYGGYYTETMQYPGSSAINVHTSSTGIVVDNNFAAYQVDLTGFDGNGIIIDLMLDGAGVVVKNNICYRNMGSGIRTVESPNCVIEKNTLSLNGYQAVNSRAGAGVFLARDSDVNQTVTDNLFFLNYHAGIKSFFTLGGQKEIDRNSYRSFANVPLIWDGWLPEENSYFSIPEIQSETGFEANGSE